MFYSEIQLDKVMWYQPINKKHPGKWVRIAKFISPGVIGIEKIGGDVLKDRRCTVLSKALFKEKIKNGH